MAEAWDQPADRDRQEPRQILAAVTGCGAYSEVAGHSAPGKR